MANETLGASFSIDITELKSGLQAANRLIRESESEFREAAAGMDDWTSSQEGLEARQKSLNKQIDLQSAKVSALTAEKKRIIAEMEKEGKSAEEIARATDDVNQAITRESKQLDKLKGELNKTEKAMDDLGDKSESTGKGVKDFGDKSKEAGDKALSLGDIIKANLISEAIIGGIKAFANGIGQIKDKMTEALQAGAAYADNILTLSTQTGLSTETLQKYNAVAELTDVSMETLTGSMAKNVKAMGEAQKGGKKYIEAYKKLGVSVTDANGNLRDSEEVYWETVDALKGIENETERDALAMELFGKKAQDLNTIIEMGSEGVKEYTDKAESMGAVLSGEGLKALGELDDQMQIFKTTTGSTGNILASAFAPAVSGVLSDVNGLAGAFNGLISAIISGTGVEDATDMVGKSINKLVAGISEAIPQMAGLVTNIVSVVSDVAAQHLPGIVSSVVSMMGEVLPPLLDAAISLIGQLINLVVSQAPKILEMLLGMAEKIVSDFLPALLGQLPTILSTIVQMIVMVVNSISTMIPTIVDAVMDVLPKLINSLLAAIPQLLEAAITLLMAIVDAIPTIITRLLDSLPSIISTLINSLLTAIPMLIDAAIQLFNAIIQAIPVIIESLIQNLPSIINTIIDGLLNAIPMLLDGAIQLLMAIIQAIPTIISILVKDIPNIVSTIIKALLSRLPDLIQGAIQLFMGIIQAIPQIIKELVKEMPTIIKTIVKGLGDGIGQVKDIGGDIIRGLWDGIKNMGSWIGEKIKGFGESVLGGIKDFFGIKSPSRVMADQVGKNLALGIGKGFEDNIGEVNKDIENAFNLKTIPVRFAANGVAGGLASGSMGQVVVNQYNTYAQAHSRYEIWQSKEDTASAVKLAMMGV